MADPKQGSDKKRPSSLAEAAAAHRSASRGGKRLDRTTMNINNPTEQAVASTPPDALGEILVERNLISRHQLFIALNESYHTGSTLREALLALGIVEEEVLSKEGL